MLTFPYHWMNRLKLSDLVFNTHYLPDTIRRTAMHVVDPKIGLHFTHEVAIQGSGGGIAGARMYLQNERTFIVANGDGVILFENEDTIERMFEFHERQDALATLLVCPLDGVGTRIPGVWLDPANGKVHHFGLKASGSQLQCLHYASVMLFDKRIWDYLPDGPSNILYDTLTTRIGEGDKVFGYRVDSMRWFETGNAVDYSAATRECLQMMNDPSSRLGACARQMVERYGPPMTHEGNGYKQMRLIADSASIADTVSLSGFSIIGPNAKVEANSRLENCIVLSSARVGPNAIHKDVIFS